MGSAPLAARRPERRPDRRVQRRGDRLRHHRPPEVEERPHARAETVGVGHDPEERLALRPHGVEEGDLGGRTDGGEGIAEPVGHGGRDLTERGEALCGHELILEGAQLGIGPSQLLGAPDQGYVLSLQGSRRAPHDPVERDVEDGRPTPAARAQRIVRARRTLADTRLAST